MPTYQSPGVYRQEKFLKPKPALPTGVPGFVGFADEKGAELGETRVALESLPEGLVFPQALSPELQKYISYDTSSKQLVCYGMMTTSGYRELWNLSAVDAFRKAVTGLYQKTQQATRVSLENLPEGLVFPDALSTELQKYISYDYDASSKQLVCDGIMTTAVYGDLWKLSATDPFRWNLPATVAFRKAIKGLYQKSQKALNLPVALYRKDEFTAHFKSLPPENSFLEDAVNGFFDNGGVTCYVVHADPTEEPKEALVAALEALSPLEDLDLVAVPDAMTLLLPDGKFDTESVLEVQKQVLAYCTDLGDRFAVLDAIRTGSPDTLLNEQGNKLRKEPESFVDEKGRQREKKAMNGALYYPWITTSTNPVRTVPPCGHVAGIYARTDGKAGVHKAPANEALLGVIDLDSPIDNKIQDQLNPNNINCLRAFPGRGIRVWGARTLSWEDNWKYVNVRRLVLTLRRWIDANMAWAAFEPNTPRLWLRIQRELGGRLSKLWQEGALKGQTAGEAFYVKCDAETNPADGREAGQVATEIGLAPSTPAEFIVVRVTHRAGTTELD